MRFLINFSYDGTNYSGYQIQPNLNTIQEELENAIYKVNNNIKRPVHSSGRTDKGVHALNQYAHVDLDINILPYKLKRALNSNLPNDIHIKDVKIVDDKFHARYNVHGKEYRYYLNMGEYNPIERNYVFQYNYKLDVASMKKAIKVFVGKHDFRSFVTDSMDKPNCVREIYDAFIEEAGEKLVFVFKGDGFLRYQVRNMVGSLIKVGEGKIDSCGLKNMLEDHDRTKGGVTAPSVGLFLVDVFYN